MFKVNIKGSRTTPLSGKCWEVLAPVKFLVIFSNFLRVLQLLGYFRLSCDKLERLTHAGFLLMKLSPRGDGNSHAIKIF